VDVGGAGAEAVFSQIEEAFRELGVVARARPAKPAVGSAGGTEVPLYVVVTILLAPFFNALVSKAGDDAYMALKKLVRRMLTVEEHEAPEVLEAGGRAGDVEFHDGEAPVRFTVDLQLPDVALRRLTEIDWAELERIRPTWQEYVKLNWDPQDENWWVALFNRRAPLAGAIIEVSESDFQTQVIEADTPLLVHFWAPWASPCQMIAPHLAELAKERDDLRIAELNVDENAYVTENFGVLTVPTLLLFKHGAEVHRIIGALPKSRLVQEIESGLAA
jgi:thioredoxin 1